MRLWFVSNAVTKRYSGSIDIASVFFAVYHVVATKILLASVVVSNHMVQLCGGAAIDVPASLSVIEGNAVYEG
jgi:hypothetical protein